MAARGNRCITGDPGKGAVAGPGAKEGLVSLGEEVAQSSEHLCRVATASSMNAWTRHGYHENFIIVN